MNAASNIQSVRRVRRSGVARGVRGERAGAASARDPTADAPRWRRVIYSTDPHKKKRSFQGCARASPRHALCPHVSSLNFKQTDDASLLISETYFSCWGGLCNVSVTHRAERHGGQCGAALCRSDNAGRRRRHILATDSIYGWYPRADHYPLCGRTLYYDQHLQLLFTSNRLATYCCRLYLS